MNNYALLVLVHCKRGCYHVLSVSLLKKGWEMGRRVGAGFCVPDAAVVFHLSFFFPCLSIANVAYFITVPASAADDTATLVVLGRNNCCCSFCYVLLLLVLLLQFCVSFF